jgi:hypothetical protein
MFNADTGYPGRDPGGESASRGRTGLRVGSLRERRKETHGKKKRVRSLVSGRIQLAVP